eukprot:Rmarinus@m.23098
MLANEPDPFAEVDHFDERFLDEEDELLKQQEEAIRKGLENGLQSARRTLEFSPPNQLPAPEGPPSLYSDSEDESHSPNKVQRKNGDTASIRSMAVDDDSDSLPESPPPPPLDPTSLGNSSVRDIPVRRRVIGSPTNRKRTAAESLAGLMSESGGAFEDDCTNDLDIDSPHQELRQLNREQVREWLRWVHPMPPRNRPSMSVRGPGGETVYLCYKSGCGPETTEAAIRQKRPTLGGLLPQSVDVLMREIREEEDSRIRTQRADDTAAPRPPMPPEHRKGRGSTKAHTQLWVDRYAPKSYFDLLSSDSINRELVRWLKHWDSRVFNKSPLGKRVVGFGNRLSKNAPEFDEDADKKVALLCGPPGYGKTTLAHVIAEHCGYRVFEVNASDQRGGDVLEAQIRSAMGNMSAFNDPRPVCVILDEIDGSCGSSKDGAGSGAVSIVLRLVGEKSKKENSSGNKSKQGPAGGSKRPIICICNDPYVNALRPLRPISKIFRFHRPKLSTVSERLHQIATKEGLTIDMNVLMQMASATNGDIRCCLNLLQMLHRTCGGAGRITSSNPDVMRAIRAKDVGKSVFDILEAIFCSVSSHLPRAAKTRKDSRGPAAQTSQNGTQPLESPFALLYNMVNNYDDIAQLVAACHESFLAVRPSDIMLNRAVSCIDWLSDHDLMRSCALSPSSGGHGLMQYLPLAAMRFRSFYAGPNAPGKNVLVLPNQWTNYRKRSTQGLSVLHSTIHGMVAEVQQGLSDRSLLLDTLTYLLHIVSPVRLRPVHQSLYSQEEHTLLEEAIGALCGAGLTYKTVSGGTQGTTSSGMRLEPPVDSLACFGSHDAPAAATPSPWRRKPGGGEKDLPIHPVLQKMNTRIQETIAHEVSMERIRRSTRVAKSREKEEKKAPYDAGTPRRQTPFQNKTNDSGPHKSHAPADMASPTAMLSALRGNARSSQSPADGAAKAKSGKLSSRSAPQCRGSLANWITRSSRKCSKEDSTQPVDEAGEKGSASIEGSSQTEPAVAKVAMDTDVGAGEKQLNGDFSISDPPTVTYRFQEGLTNAVRRPVYVKDFL